MHFGIIIKTDQDFKNKYEGDTIKYGPNKIGRTFTIEI